MQIEKVNVHLGETINLGNYESSRVDIMMEARIDEGEDADEVYRRLYEKVRTLVDEEVDKPRYEQG